MSFMNKIKDFFYDEEEIEEEVKEPKKEPKLKKRTSSNVEKKINIYDIEKEKEKLENTRKIKTNVNDISEKELFKSERTFNFPIDVEDDNDFEPVKKENLNLERKIRRDSTPNISRTKKTDYSYSPLRSHISKKEETHFKPTPIISPIYGILDQNYKKEDIKESPTKELSFDKKEVDFDTIRRKAYKTLDEEIEKTISDTKKDIFYNIEDSKEELPDKNTKEELKEEYVEKPYKKDEVIITYEDEEEKSEELEVPKITRSKKNDKVAKQVESEEDDSQDLFKIIDDMYKESDEED